MDKMLKNKIKTFLSKEDPNRSNHVDISEATTVTQDFAKQNEVVREFADDPTPDHEIIEGIEKVYFSDMNFDSSLFELKKLPEVLVEDDLDKYRNNLRRQLQAVSRQLSKKILDNQSSYVRELDRVMDLQWNLQTATLTCSRGRGILEYFEQEIALTGLGILAKNRRKLWLQKLLKSLRFIKTLQETDVRLKELLQETHYARAIQLCLECQQAAVTFHQYTCITELSSNLQEILEQIEEQLDVALSKLCIIFDSKEYGEIQEAYKLLDKTQTAMDQLQMHFVNTINNVAVKTLTDSIKHTSGRKLADQTYQGLCQDIPFENFTDCLINLCKNFWQVMYSYKQMTDWHDEHSKSHHTDEENEEKKDTLVAMFDENYIKSKLEQGLNRIWQDIQQKIKIYLHSTNFGLFSYDEFLKVLDIINRLIYVGTEFSQKKSELLQDSLKSQTEVYFKAHHKATLEELRMFLENEVWELCPVKSSFNITHMQEFLFLKSSTVLINSENTVNDGIGVTYFGKDEFNADKSPFDNMFQETNKSSNMYDDYIESDEEDDDDEDDVPEELKRDYVDENTGEETSHPKLTKKRSHKEEGFPENTPIVTNTTLNVLRSFGKYMQMMTVLKPIAFTVVTCMSQLFDYYLYSVYSFFARKDDGNLIVDVNIKLRQCLQRIYKEINDPEENQKIPTPLLSPMVNLLDSSQLYGFRHRLIGVESVIFLSKQLHTLRKHLEAYIIGDKKLYLNNFFSQTVDICNELRSPIYRSVVEKAIKYDSIRSMMSQVKWDLKEIISQHSPYIDALVQEYNGVQSKIESFSSLVPLPRQSLSVMWSDMIFLTNHTFVEGFSNVKKCSNEGRALMLLDFQQFLIKIDKITSVKPAPGRSFVENYIKAYYLTEQELEKWLKDHAEYTPKQLNNLVNCGTGSHIGKKVKQKLTGILEELQEAKSKGN